MTDPRLEQWMREFDQDMAEARLARGRGRRLLVASIIFAIFVVIALLARVR